MKWIWVGTAVVLVGLYFALNQSKAHNANHVATRGAGIGQPSSFQNVKAFPVGQIAQSVASIGSSLFGGHGTHSPVDPTIKSPGAMGDPMQGKIMTSLDGPGTAGQAIPAPSVVQTQIDGYSPNTPMEASVAPAADPVVTQSDFTMDV